MMIHFTLIMAGLIMTEPAALKCNGCGEYSQFNVKYHTQLPTGWVVNDKGYFCKECKKDKKK